MTVGVSAITKYGDEDTIVFSSDRMVTVGRGGGVEYEDTQTKMVELVDNSAVSAVAVGAGISTFIDEVFERFEDVREQSEPPESVEFVVQMLTVAFQARVQDAVENQVTQAYGYSLDDLKDPNVEIPQSLEQTLMNDVKDITDASNQVQILVGGVDADGAEIHQVVGMERSTYTDIGYSVVGSGTDSARLTFIRRGYDRSCSLAEGVFTVLEAKRQAEERQGVGDDSDMLLVDKDGIRDLDDQLNGLESMLDEIEAAEREAREEVITDWTLE